MAVSQGPRPVRRQWMKKGKLIGNVYNNNKDFTYKFYGSYIS